METQNWDRIGFLKGILTAMCKYPDEIKIDEIVDEKGVLLTVTTAREDMGKIIGKEGIMAQAIRLVVKSAGRNHDAIISVKIGDVKEIS
jgi:predicted RNA-binding protein YlqC (UPF0109 family)